MPISPLEQVALYNAASEQAQGEYLVLLATDSEVVNPNWIESLLNHAQRPEVGIVGAKLVDRDGKISQAGLILGLERRGGVRPSSARNTRARVTCSAWRSSRTIRRCRRCA